MSLALAADQLARGGGDVVGVDPRPGEQFLAGPGTRHLADREASEMQVVLPGGELRVGDGRASTGTASRPSTRR